MPTYDYRCEKCGGTFEFRQSMKDPRLTECPRDACLMETWGHGDVTRQLGTGAGLIFKGSGFYITDYRSENYKASAKADAPAAAPASTPSPATPAPATPAAPAKSDAKPSSGAAAAA